MFSTHSKRPLFAALLTLTAAVLLSQAGATGTAANTSISNTGVFDYLDDAGTAKSVSSTPVTITVAQIAGVSLNSDGTLATPGQTVYAAPGTTGVLTYTLTNTGNGPDTVKLSSQDGAGGALTGVTYYYDAALTQPVPATGVPLVADEVKTVYAAFSVPTGATAGNAIYVNPVGTSTYTSSVFDSNNVGLISAKSVHAVSLTTDNALQATTPGSAVGAHSLKNIGNTPIRAGDLTLSAVTTDASGILSTVTYQFRDGAAQSGAASSDINVALSNYLSSVGPLAAGQTLTLSTTYVTAAGKTAGQSASHVAKAYFTQTSSSSDTYSTTAASALSGTDFITLIAGNASVSKVADNCGLDVTCASPVLNASSAKPGEYVRYTITVRNIGLSALKMPILHDTLSTDLLFVSASASSTQSGVLVKSVFSTDNAAYSATAPATVAAGGTLYAGLNTTGGSSKPSAADALAGGETFSLVILTKVK
jgi:uncharacterized repeat protein (TIGR01451 family)